jgi:alkane 1-monooxygenase
MSLWIVAAVPRHSHHHADAQVEHYELKPLPEAPTTLGGYVVTGLISLVPPLWHALMSPRLLEWDVRYATPAEQRLAAEENLRSGIPLLVRAGEQYLAREPSNGVSAAYA